MLQRREHGTEHEEDDSPVDTMIVGFNFGCKKPQLRFKRISYYDGWISVPGTLVWKCGERTCHSLGMVFSMHTFYHVSCMTRNDISRSCKIIIDCQQSLLYMDCGCHLSVKPFINRMYDHMKLGECLEYIDELLQCALIGFNRDVIPRDVFSGTRGRKFYRETATPIPDSFSCKNCDIMLCYRLNQFLEWQLHENRLMNQFQGSNPLFAISAFVYVVAKLLTVSLRLRHTAAFWTMRTFRTMHIMAFVNLALNTFTTFNKDQYGVPIADTQLNMSSFVALCCNQFIVFMNLLSAHCKKAKDSVTRKGIDISFAAMHKKAVLSVGRAMTDWYQHKEFFIKQYGREIYYNFIGCMRLYESIVLDKGFLSVGFYRYFMSIQSQQELTLKPIRCQWKHCRKIEKLTVEDGCHIASGEVVLRKCSGCHLARYCSKRCQKHDWNLYHRLVCKSVKVS